MVIRAACSSPRAPGPRTAAASTLRRPSWPPRTSRSRSLNASWRARDVAPGPSAGMGFPARPRARFPLLPGWARHSTRRASTATRHRWRHRRRTRLTRRRQTRPHRCSWPPTTYRRPLRIYRLRRRLRRPTLYRPLLLPTPCHRHRRPTPCRPLRRPTPCHRHRRPTPCQRHRRPTPCQRHRRPTPCHRHRRPTLYRPLLLPTLYRPLLLPTLYRPLRRPTPCHRHRRPTLYRPLRRPTLYRPLRRPTLYRPLRRPTLYRLLLRPTPCHRHRRPTPCHPPRRTRPSSTPDSRVPPRPTRRCRTPMGCPASRSKPRRWPTPGNSLMQSTDWTSTATTRWTPWRSRLSSTSPFDRHPRTQLCVRGCRLRFTVGELLSRTHPFFRSVIEELVLPHG